VHLLLGEWRGGSTADVRESWTAGQAVVRLAPTTGNFGQRLSVVEKLGRDRGPQRLLLAPCFVDQRADGMAHEPQPKQRKTTPEPAPKPAGEPEHRKEKKELRRKTSRQVCCIEGQRSVWVVFTRLTLCNMANDIKQTEGAADEPQPKRPRRSKKTAAQVPQQTAGEEAEQANEQPHENRTKKRQEKWQQVCNCLLWGKAGVRLGDYSRV
jgi:hypothetical protein